MRKARIRQVYLKGFEVYLAVSLLHSDQTLSRELPLDEALKFCDEYNLNQKIISRFNCKTEVAYFVLGLLVAGIIFSLYFVILNWWR